MAICMSEKLPKSLLILHKAPAKLFNTVTKVELEEAGNK